MLEAFIDAPLRHSALTVFPVIAPHGPVLPYLLTTEIHDEGILTLRERGDAEEPMLLARNNSLHPILMLAGEPLPGGNRGRVLERSILLRGKSVTQLPSPSTESGGWVTPEQEAEITEWLQSFPVVKHQVGLLACLEDRILGLEALGSENLYAPLHRRLLIRFMKKALSFPLGEPADLSYLEGEAQKMVDAIEEAERVAGKRVGVGEYRLLRGPVTGAELLHQGHLVHLSVHPTKVKAVSTQ